MKVVLTKVVLTKVVLTKVVLKKVILMKVVLTVPVACTAKNFMKTLSALLVFCSTLTKFEANLLIILQEWVEKEKD